MDGYFRGRRYRSQTYVRFKFCHPNRRAGEMEWEQKRREVAVRGEDLWV